MSERMSETPEDRIEGLLRAARPEPAAPLSEERAQEIFARALALSGGAAEPAPKAAPWWRRLVPAPLPSSAVWGGAGAVAACSLAALLLFPNGGVGGGADAPTATVAAAPIPAPSLTATTLPVERAVHSAPAPAAVAQAAPVEPRVAPVAVVAKEAGAPERKPRASGRRVLRPRPTAPPAGPRVDRPATMLAAAGDDSPRLLVVASGVLPAEDDQNAADGAAGDPFVTEDSSERLIVAVAENVPASQPGRAEAAAVREWPAAAGPAGPEGGEEGPAFSPGDADSAPRPTLVWAQASVASDEEPTLVLTEMQVEEAAEEEAPALP